MKSPYFLNFSQLIKFTQMLGNLIVVIESSHGRILENWQRFSQEYALVIDVSLQPTLSVGKIGCVRF